jgi:hypothetical protein
MSPAERPTISLRTVRQHVARLTAVVEHNGALFNEHVLPRLGTVEALTAAHRDDLLEAEERSLDAERRLWRHRVELDKHRRIVSQNAVVLKEVQSVVNKNAEALRETQDALNTHFDSHAAMRGSLRMRLRWLFTGKVC